MRLAIAALALLSCATPTLAAQGGDTPFDVLVRVNGPVRIAANDTAESVIVIADDAFVDGTINGSLLVVNGRAEISGTVQGDVVVFGDLYLSPGSRITDDVTVYGGAFSRDVDTVVLGTVHLDQTLAFRGPDALTIFLSIGVFLLGATFLFTLAAWRPLSNGAALVLAHPFNVLAVGTLVALSTPLAAIALLPTGIGLLLGLAMLVCIIPAAIFIGFLVSAMAVGDWIARREPNLVPARAHTRALAEVAIGVAALMVLLLIPIVGAALLLVASTMGVGALVSRSWEEWPRKGQPVAKPTALPQI
jgi:hypothetical protein